MIEDLENTLLTNDESDEQENEEQPASDEEKLI